MTVTVVDTGLAQASSEFSGRISPDSRSFDSTIARCATCAPETVHFGLEDVDGHGTETAAIALAARDGAGMHGVAPEATLLALKIAAPDLDGVTATSPIRESGNANVALIAPALTYAVEHGAFAISMSLNGTSSGQTAADQRAAMDKVAAADRLLVQSVSNDVGDQSSAPGTITRALVGAGGENRDWFLFGIRLNPDGSAPSGNGLPGDLADRTLAVVATQVQSVGIGGQPVTVTGNSFAAPAIAGAAAILKQYWPQLAGKAIARILLDTATDLGPVGVDQQFGAGLLNLENALKAQAPASSFVQAESVIAHWSSLSVSPAFGGTATAATLNGRLGALTVLDRYGRDYRLTGNAGVRARGAGLLSGALAFDDGPLLRQASPYDHRFGFADTGPVGPWQGVASGRPVSGFVPLGSGRSLAFAANAVVGGSASASGSFLRSVVAQPVGASASVAADGWSLSAASGASRDRRASIRSFLVTTPLGVGLEIASLAEGGRVLGLDGGRGLDLGGARTTPATLSARRAVGAFLLSARATVGSTRATGSDTLRFSGPVVSAARSRSSSTCSPIPRRRP